MFLSAIVPAALVIIAFLEFERKRNYFLLAVLGVMIYLAGWNLSYDWGYYTPAIVSYAGLLLFVIVWLRGKYICR